MINFILRFELPTFWSMPSALNHYTTHYPMKISEDKMILNVMNKFIRIEMNSRQGIWIAFVSNAQMGIEEQ